MPFQLDHDGCRLSYEVAGSGSPVLFIQGVGVHGEGWRPQVDALAGRYRCLWFDSRGIAASQPTGGPLTVQRLAADALALVDAQGWDSVHVVGHSLGGLVAQSLALTAPTRVRSLALLCTFANGRDAGRPTPWMIWVGSRTRIGTRRMRRRAFLQLVMPPRLLAGTDRDALAARLAPIFGHDLADQPPVVGPQLAAMRAFDATPRLAELAVIPTLVVSATHDRIASVGTGRALAAGIPGARFVEIPDASHGLPIHLADSVNGLLIEHFAASEGAGLRPAHHQASVT